MGLFDFVKSAGEKIFKPGEARREKAIENHLSGYGINGVTVEVDGDTAVLSGSVADAATREKAVLAAGNVEGIEKVDDRLRVTKAGADFSNVRSTADTVANNNPAAGASASTAHASQGSGDGWTSKTYTVKSGDTLSKISKEFYGDANKYNQIFEANKPMLKDPDKIYPGQVLRIPAEQ